MAIKIYLSPSDQTGNLYAAGGTNEAVQCRKIADAAQKFLEQQGFLVLNNKTDAMSARIAESNTWGADAHIPIHTNAFNGNVQGTRLFCYDGSGAGYRLSTAILDALAPVVPGTSDSVTTANFAEILQVHAPAAYVEAGFHDNPQQAQWIIDHTEAIGQAIARGISNYYGLPVQQAYTLEAFIREVQTAIGAAADGIPGPETLSKTPTLSRNLGRNHPAVLPVQKRLLALGYDQVGIPDGIAGNQFTAGVTAFQRDRNIPADGEITAGKKTWQLLLGMA